MTRQRRLSLGGLSAESDPLLNSAFFDDGTYAEILDKEDPHWFIVGRTGSGKSALLRRLEEQNPAKVARIKPRELAFEYIINVNAVRTLLDNNVRMEPFFHALWRYILLSTVARHRFSDANDQVKRGLFERFRAKLRKGAARPGALEYLDSIEATFWQATEVQVRHHVDALSEKVGGAMEAKAGVPLASLSASVKSTAERTTSQEERRDVTEKLQRVVSQEVVTGLNSIMVALTDEVLESAQHFTYVIVDDLDLTWVEDHVANILIKCLMQVAIEVQSTLRHVKLLIALRTNIFEQLHIGEQTRGGQEEKLRAAALHLRWRRESLEALLDRRVHAASGKAQRASVGLHDLLPSSQAQGRTPLKFLLSRTLMRPRDAISYLNLCLQETGASARISWETIRSVEYGYSVDRLTALRDEWNDPYFDVARVFECFRGRSELMTGDQFRAVAEDVALLLEYPTGTDPVREFKGSAWLTELCEPLWQAGASRRPWQESCSHLASFLFQLGFLGYGRGQSGNMVFAEDASVAEVHDFAALPPDSTLSIHPAFRPALGTLKGSTAG